MEGNNIKAFLSKVESLDRSLLKMLTKFHIEERQGKIHLTTEDKELLEFTKKLLLSKLGNSLTNLLVFHLDGSAGGSNEEEEPKQCEGLNRKYSFENFVVGEGNRLAYEVAREVALSPGKSYNPLFIYGGVGLGKTHLLQAIGNECASKGHSVVYKSANDFSEEMVQAIKTGKISDFRNRYRQVDVLLLDDVQFLSGKERTQIEFFNVFNFMFMKDKQIVLASDRHPRELRDVSDRLISRFEGGLVVEVCMDELTKLEIIKRKLQELRIEFQDKIVELILKQTSDNVRDIEGTIRSIKLQGIEHFKKKKIRGSEIDKVRIYTALHFGLKPEDLLANNRSRKINKVRHIAFYLCKRLTDASLIEIARAFNRKDHSTVIHGIKRIEEEKKKDRKLSYILSFLEKHIGDRL